jgi:co-chaperonin GroES (HSP10)
VSTELVRVENDMEKMKEAQKKTVAAKGERKGEAKEEEAKEEAVSHPGVVAAEKAATSINFWTVNNFFQKTMADGSSAAADVRTTARVIFDSYCGIDGDTNHEGVLSLTDLDVMLRHFFDHLIQTFTDPERFASAHFNIPDRVLLDEVLRARFRLERLRFRLLAQGWLSMMIHKDVEHISNVCRDYID